MEQRADLITGKRLLAIAETAVDLQLVRLSLLLLFLQKLQCCLLANGTHRAKHPLAIAVAAVFHRQLVKYIVRNITQRKVCDGFVAVFPFKQARDVGKQRDILFQLRDDLLVRKGQQLHHNATRRTAGAIGIHQHPQSQHRGNLLTGRIVGGDILCDFSAAQRDRTNVRRLSPRITNNMKQAASNSTAHVEFSI